MFYVIISLNKELPKQKRCFRVFGTFFCETIYWFKSLVHPLALLFIAVFLGVWTCSVSSRVSTGNTVQREVASVVVEQQAAEGLDLQALPDVVKEATNSQHLEEILNLPGGVNNLDLNADGKTDFIKVSEFGDKQSGTYGFSLTTEVAPGEEQELAQIEISQAGDKADVLVNGNEQVYGRGVGYGSSFPIGSFLLMSYLLRPHPFYFSPWGYGAYPGYYSSHATRGANDYRNDVASRKNASATGRSSSLKSPNAGKTANQGIKSKLANPTSSQKSFRANNVRPSQSRGFGKRSSGVRNFSSSRRGFGGFGK